MKRQCANCATPTDGRLCEPCGNAQAVEKLVRDAQHSAAHSIECLDWRVRKGLPDGFDLAAAETALTAARDALNTYQPVIR